MQECTNIAGVDFGLLFEEREIPVVPNDTYQYLPVYRPDLETTEDEQLFP